MSKILVIAASNNNNLKLAESFKSEIEKQGQEAEVVDLVAMDLPLYSSKSEEDGGIPGSLEATVGKLTETQKFVFITPEYNGGIAPTLNNFIAWVSRAGGKDWRVTLNDKTAAIATFSGGGGQHALMLLRTQLAYVGMNVLGRQTVATFTKPDVSKSIEGVVKSLIKS